MIEDAIRQRSEAGIQLKLLHNWVKHRSNYKRRKTLRTPNLPLSSDVFTHITLLFVLCYIVNNSETSTKKERKFSITG